MKAATILAALAGLATALPQEFPKHTSSDAENKAIVDEAKSLCAGGKPVQECPKADEAFLNQCPSSPPEAATKLATECKNMDTFKEDQNGFWSKVVGAKLMRHGDSPIHNIRNIACCKPAMDKALEEHKKNWKDLLGVMDLMKTNITDVKNLVSFELGPDPIAKVEEIARRVEYTIGKAQSLIKSVRLTALAARHNFFDKWEPYQKKAEEARASMTEVEKVLGATKVLVTAVKRYAGVAEGWKNEDLRKMYKQGIAALEDVAMEAEDVPLGLGNMFKKFDGAKEALLDKLVALSQ
ncbi:hypothetical protein HIM_05391 [Hirsutella minnesotensis 3608]|uniref:Uncharacterized protein n=1 Tax=Hirsutella minnesotensis 3608 TaxID=1043627 RepID=A0A0F8A0B4_9HYPO|nr:hypothetical protein HIM_05391 [Hirsutella minnesotensis 3608]